MILCLGLIIEWKAEQLYLTDRDVRLKHDPNTPGKIKGQDHAGHLAGDRFGGSPLRDNLVSQLSGVNLSDYKVLENSWERAIKEGRSVSVNVQIEYIEGSLRPHKFHVTTIIDGKPSFITIPNY